MMVGFLTRGLDDELTPEALQKMGSALGIASDNIPDILIEPGAFNVLNPGQDVKFNTPADVGASFDPFLRANYRAVAASAGVLFQELTGDWTGTNDRSFRAMFNTFKRQATAWQYNLVVVQFCQPVWNRFIDYALASGIIVAPDGVSDADMRAVAWAPDRWPYINPTQDVEATGNEISLGLTSRQAAIAERGDDVEVIDQQIAADREREENLGLSFGLTAAGITPPSDTTAGQPAS